ncbi:hypothetical protein SMC26_22345 [Actinomadura fulvescens]|uniref:Galactokinase n=1 Tax=Actinomadura fulvescens TaxID=46160 RepID=A0ABN3PHH8_9ACTN
MHDLVSRLDAKPELRLVPYTFQRAYGRPPEGVWTAPYAVRLAGHAVAFAVQWQVIVAAAPRSDTTLRLASLNRPAEWLETDVRETAEDVPAWAAGPYDALRRAGPPLGADILVHADLPAVTGLCADVPLACATVLAATEVHGAGLARDELAHLIASDPVIAAAVLAGRAGHAVGEGTVRLPFDPRSAGLSLLLIVTRAASPAPASTSAGAPPPDTGRLIRLLRGGDLAAAARSLAGHARTGSAEATTAIDAACGAGALAAWPHGPAVVAIMPAAARPAVRASVSAAFGERGPRPPRFLNLTVAGAARRQA